MNEPCSVVAIGQLVMDMFVRTPEDALGRLGIRKGVWQTIDKPRLEEVLAGLPHQAIEMPGGSSANTLVSLAHLGVHTRLLGVVGRGPRAAKYHESLTVPDSAAGSVTLDLVERDGPTGVVLCLVTPDAERTMLALPGVSLDMKASDLRPEQMAGARYLHLTGYLVGMDDGKVLVRAAELAHQAGALVSFDLAATPLVDRHRDFFTAFIDEHVDLLMGNEEEARLLVGGDTTTAVHDLAVRVHCVVVKRGDQGAVVAAGPVVTDVPAERVRAIDTTGAGDGFAAGFIFGALLRLPPVACARAGSALAARLVEVMGARLPEELWPTIVPSLRGLASRLTKAQRSLDDFE